MPKHLKRGMSEEGSSGSSSTTSDVTTRVNETVFHRAKSSHQDACGKRTCTCTCICKRIGGGVEKWERGKEIHM